MAIDREKLKTVIGQVAEQQRRFTVAKNAQDHAEAALLVEVLRDLGDTHSDAFLALANTLDDDGTLGIDVGGVGPRVYYSPPPPDHDASPFLIDDGVGVRLKRLRLSVEVLDYVRADAVIDRIIHYLGAQLEGKKPKRTQEIEARTARLRAIAVLVREGR